MCALWIAHRCVKSIPLPPPQSSYQAKQRLLNGEELEEAFVAQIIEEKLNSPEIKHYGETDTCFVRSGPRLGFSMLSMKYISSFACLSYSLVVFV